MVVRSSSCSVMGQVHECIQLKRCTLDVLPAEPSGVRPPGHDTLCAHRLQVRGQQGGGEVALTEINQQITLALIRLAPETVILVLQSQAVALVP